MISLTPVLEPVFTGFQSRMASLGYVAGQNVTYLYDGPTRAIDQLDDVARRLVQARVDLILAISTPAAQAARRATAATGTPVLFVPIFDPVAAGLVDSLQRPGGNMTGVHWGLAEGQRLMWLLALAPEVRRVYVPYNPNDLSPVLALDAIRPVAEQAGVELVTRPARTPEEMATVTAVPDDVDAVFLLPDNLIATRLDELAQLALIRRLPVSVPTTELMRDGVLYVFGHGAVQVGQQTARLADQVLRGVAPADLPVETAEIYLTINLETAQAIGLDIPGALLRQADTLLYTLD